VVGLNSFIFASSAFSFSSAVTVADFDVDALRQKKLYAKGVA